MLDFTAIFVIVERGKADHIVNETKKVGAFGATVFYARGTGEQEFKKFFNLNIESSKEIILILTPSEQKEQIKSAVVDAGKLKEPGTGILFTVPIDELVGLNHRRNIAKK